MSTLYEPDPNALVDGLTNIKQLSERDVARRVPVNFVPVPGVVLTAACFPNGRYEASAATKCVSNLLASGFRRLYIDLYWDATRSVFAFCPVELGEANPSLSSTQAQSTTSVRTSETGTLSSGKLSGRDAAATPTSLVGVGKRAGIQVRQTSNGAALASETSFSSGAATSESSATSTYVLSTNVQVPSTVSSEAASTSKLPSGSTLIEIGPYKCTPSLDFSTFMQILTEHFDATETDLNATTKYVIMNLNAASPASDPTGPPGTIDLDRLPRSTNLLSQLITANTSQYLYTPANLLSQRSNLNTSGSWFEVGAANAPDPAYFQVQNQGSYASSPDGWPSEGYIEFTNAKRTLFGFGTVATQMNAYNFSADASTIFTAGYLQDFKTFTTSNNGGLTAGCIFNAEETSFASVNSSWAMGSDRIADLHVTDTGAGNLTGCGISPILNVTLSSASADISPAAYLSFAEQAIWSWAPDEPRNRSTSAQSSDDVDYTNYACAALNASSGRWQADDCGRQHFSACRPNTAPYSWQISSADASYTNAEFACPENTTFRVPRTGLENQYLLSAFNSFRASSNTAGRSDELLWLNFNDLDTADCWVIGQNTTCPYSAQTTTPEREIVVPAVFGVIVFLIVVLTVFVKCASNRQSNRRGRRRKGDDGWDYEGVPA